MDIFTADPKTEITVTLTVNEIRCLLGTAARDADQQASRRNRCKEGSDNYYDADHLHRSAEIAREAMYRILGWSDR